MDRMQISVPAGGNGAVATSIVGASVLSIILTVVGLLAGVIGPMTGLTLLGSALAVITVVDRECRAVLLQGLGVPPRVVLRLN
jgi:hypothetical protein